MHPFLQACADCEAVRLTVYEPNSGGSRRRRAARPAGKGLQESLKIGFANLENPLEMRCHNCIIKLMCNYLPGPTDGSAGEGNPFVHSQRRGTPG